MSSIKQVEEFHRVFGHPIAETPGLASAEVMALRIKLLREEVDEYADAVLNGDLVEIADALTDIQYILNGGFLIHGLQDLKHNLNCEVHRSNMSKLCKTRRQAEDIIDERTGQDGPDCFYEEKSPDQFILYRGDGKVMKGPDYSKPNLKAIIDAHKRREET
jgi:predicted HAD superfamily Cof-like phosphohydrolase